MTRLRDRAGQGPAVRAVGRALPRGPARRPRRDAGRRLLIPSSDPGIEFLVVKPGDVPVYVESGAADLGVTGTDVLRETGADVLEPLELGFGFCRLVVAAPADAPLSRPARGASPPGWPPSILGWPRRTSAPRAGRWTSSR